MLAVVLGVTCTLPTLASAQVGYKLAEGSFFAMPHRAVPGTGGASAGPQVHPDFLRLPTLAQPEIHQAGAHPDATTGFRLEDPNGSRAPQVSREIVVDAPAGFIGNPEAVPICPMAKFFSDRQGDCPVESQVGISSSYIAFQSTVWSDGGPVYRLPASKTAPARFGFRTWHGESFILEPTVRSDGDYGIKVSASDLPPGLSLLENVTTLWGVPHDPIHDIHRYTGGPSQSTGVLSAEAHASAKPFLTNPTYCDSGRLPTHLGARSWLEPTRWERAVALSSQEPEGCEKLEFGTVKAPVSLDIRPDRSRASSPAGLDARLRLPYNEDPNGLARPTLRDTVVTLPEGMTVNPSAAGGLEACGEDEVGFKSMEAPRCPAGSKLASVSVVTPVLKEPLHGAIYMAEQYRNPLGALMAIYLHVAGEGVKATVVGGVERDSATGQITATFENNPQLPFTEMDVRFKSGERAPVANPDVCGVHTARSTITPWSSPHSGPPVVWNSNFSIDHAPARGACVDDLADRGFEPGFKAGTSNPVAAADTSFSVIATRVDGEQEMSSLRDVVLPQGLLGRIADIELCSSAAADTGTCSDASRIGRVKAAVGVGASPFWAPEAGKKSTGVYLTGPYRGAPYGLSVVVPAQAGPFDLGQVVVRSAVRVDERTAQVSSGVDESLVYDTDGTLTQRIEGAMPQIVEGIPLKIKEVRVLIDRDRFMVGPTDCAEQRIRAEVGGADGVRRAVSTRFQVTDCSTLPFKPRLDLKLTGKSQVRTGKHPGIRAEVNQTGVGEAGIERAVVRLPKSLALDVDNAQALCEYVDGTKPDLEKHCPKGSIVGRARAESPLLKGPLTGDVYFVKNVRRDARTGNAIRTLPMIVVALRGEVAINLVGTSSTTKSGKLVSTFTDVPDAPVSKFNLDIYGGGSGIIAVTRTRRSLINLCANPNGHMAEAEMDGQNGKRYDRDIRMKTPCTKKQIKKAQRAAKKAARKAARARR